MSYVTEDDMNTEIKETMTFDDEQNARKQKEEKIEKMQQKQGINEQTLTKIFDFIDKDECDRAKKLIPVKDRHLPLAVRNHPGARWHGYCYLLHFAVFKDCQDIIEYLLDGGANIESKGTSFNDTALLVAVKYGTKECCKLLLDRGANIDACDYDGSTSLHAAALHHYTSTVKLLLSRGARTDIKNKVIIVVSR